MTYSLRLCSVRFSNIPYMDVYLQKWCEWSDTLAQLIITTSTNSMIGIAGYAHANLKLEKYKYISAIKYPFYVLSKLEMLF